MLVFCGIMPGGRIKVGGGWNRSGEFGWLRVSC